MLSLEIFFFLQIISPRTFLSFIKCFKFSM